MNKQPSKSDRLPLIDELSLITKANDDGGATAAAVAGSAATTTNARYTANISAGSSWTSLSKCSGIHVVAHARVARLAFARPLHRQFTATIFSRKSQFFNVDLILLK